MIQIYFINTRLPRRSVTAGVQYTSFPLGKVP